MDRPPLLDYGPWTEVLAAATANPYRCGLHRFHRPRELTLDLHHLWPLAMGGPAEQWNTIPACPTGHANVHLLMRALHLHTPMRGGHYEQRIAALGIALWNAAGNPGNQVTLADET